MRKPFSVFLLNQSNRFSAAHLFTFIIGILAITMIPSAFADGSDILQSPTADLFVTFKNTGIKLIILTEIVTGLIVYAKSKNLAVFIGLPVVLLITTWASTQF